MKVPEGMIVIKDRIADNMLQQILTRTDEYDVLALPIKEAREIFEKNYLLSQIKRFNGNIIKISEITGMERTALYRKLKSLNINLNKI